MTGMNDGFLHPAIQRLAEKGYDNGTLDEMAIVNLARRSMREAFENFQQIKVWLQQENPLNLRGSDLSEWATEVAACVLPTQMRSMYAPETRKQQEGSQPEHQAGNQSWQASEASSSDSTQQSRQVQQGEG